MTTRLAVCLLAAPALLYAQLQLFLVEGGAERRIEGGTGIGSVKAGDFLDVTLRLRNRGTNLEPLNTITVLDGWLRLLTEVHPVQIAPGAELDFVVRFTPSAVGPHPGRVQVNADSYTLLGEGTEMFLSLVENGGRTLLGSASVVDFSAGATHRFLLENRSVQEVTVNQLAVTGAAFEIPAGPALPLTLQAWGSVEFTVARHASSAGRREGELLVEGRSFRLHAAAPDLPRPEILIDPQTARSGQQARVSIHFPSPAPAAATGTLRIEFTGSGDPAVGFLSPAGRSAEFTVVEGETAARFAGRTEIEFQTGTTAGTILFTAELGPWAEQASLQLAPLAVVIDSSRASRTSGSVEVRISGFDNTRSAGPIAFTFFDHAGAVLGAGPVRLDAAPDFQRHFDSSDAGGLFSLRAVFPVRGDTTAIHAVEVEIGNSAGQSQSGRVQF